MTDHSQALDTKRPYEVILEELKEKAFLKPDGSNVAELVHLVQVALTLVLSSQGTGPIYPINIGRSKTTELVRTAEIPTGTTDPEQALQALPAGMQGSVIAGNPYMVKNIIPTPALIHLATQLAVSLYMPNAVTGEDAGETLNAEISCASAIARLAGLDPEKSAGVFTFGGTGTNLYGFKMGLAKADPRHSLKGVSGNTVVVGSKPAHYSHQTAADWLGLGQEQYLQVSSNLDQTTRLDEMEATCRRVIEEGKRIACIEAVGGTTSNMAIDDIEAIYNMRERLVADHGLDHKPHIHVDSVLGWVYLNFIDYDFEDNPLGFSPNVIERLKKIVERISKLKFADSFGVDFHKTGYMPYVSSMVIVKDRTDLLRLRRDGNIMTPLFHDAKAYNPGTFTLETSRSSATILATWMTLQSLGQKGYQALLGHTLEMSEHMRELIGQHQSEGLFVVNQEPFGCDLFVRCYPPQVDPSTTHEKELVSDEAMQGNTTYTNQFAQWLFANKSQGDEGIALSKTSAAFYTQTGAPVVALRIYPLNPHITRETATNLIDRLVQAKHEFDHL